MTQNQINWFKASEDRRHNLTVEAETGRHNVEDESIRYEGNLINREANTINDLHFQRMDQENRRHNTAAESVSWFQSKEQKRHNKVSERQSSKTIKESKRHNRASEDISRFQSLEQRRHNLATEGVDWANVGIGRMNAATNRQNAASNWQNALTNMSNADLRSQELDLARNQYSLDQWSASQKVPAEVGRIETQSDLTKEQIRYQELMNDYYLLDRAGDILSGAFGGVPIDESTHKPNTGKGKGQVKSFTVP